MSKEIFIDRSRAAAMALRRIMDQADSRCQYSYSFNTLYPSLEECGVLSRRRALGTRKLSQEHEPSTPIVGQTSGLGLRRSASCGKFSKRLKLACLDQDTKDQVNRLLDGGLPDTELQGLGKKIANIIGQLSVSCPQRNALIELLNYINAQGSIVLGYKEDVLTPKIPGGDVIPAIGCPLWSVPVFGFESWGMDFRKRLEYVSSQGGDITFILPEGKYGHTFTAQGVFTSYHIWKEILRQIDSMDPQPNYRNMCELDSLIGSKFLSCSKKEDLRILYAYHIFCLVYASYNRRGSLIATTPIDKSTIGARVRSAIEAWKEHGCKIIFRSGNKGEVSHFELAYLLHAGTKFKIVATEEKIQSFRDFPVDESDPDGQECRDRIRKSAAPST
ncbi:MAG: hypothetical protein LBS22_01870 [Puniceicoccales bacterium]|jgi:hypothetical protein|nr:hypothetical protein [Puniceicoccales bacterium]